MDAADLLFEIFLSSILMLMTILLMFWSLICILKNP